FHGTRCQDFENRLYSDSKCTGCKTCEKTCLSGKIKLQEGRPIWQKDAQCTFCFACIHYCPAQAIQVGKSKTPEKGRYFHPEVTAKDIAGQK
ncbi:MAG TPA: 4Fe-4S dicluster domain-containing protein, partial [Bacillota bacterium]|nr:4Fe-4S dicluster domain-containing protein [Bacillota bacterium]